MLDGEGGSLPIQVPLEKPGNDSNALQTISLLIYTEVSKHVINVTGEVVKCCVHGVKS